MIKKIIKNIVAKLGFKLISDYDFHRNRNYVKLLESFVFLPSVAYHNKGEIIIFSKDRAIQLEALLRSFYQFGKHPVKLHVLFNASTQEHTRGYQKLIQAYSSRSICFIEENNFRKDLIALFKKLEGDKVFFLVDDLFFKEEFNLNEFFSINPKKYVASLRMGSHLNYAYTLQKQQPLPLFEATKEHPTMLCWDWQAAESDWSYPLSVDGHLFDTKEIKLLVEELEYKAPNSFEEALQIMKPLFAQRKGLCYKQSIIVNNPCNKVQTENKNIHGQLSVEELNRKWLDGYRIDLSAYERMANTSAHQELPIIFRKDE